MAGNHGVTHPSTRLIQLAQTIAEGLSRELSATYCVWARDEAWTRIGHLSAIDIESTELLTDQDVARQLEQHGAASAPSLVPLGDDRCLVLVPVYEGGLSAGSMVVVGEQPEAPTAALARLVDLIVRHAVREREHQHAVERIRGYVRQVTSDFEELTWLRGLAERIEVCDLQNDIVTTAATVLPSLNDLIASEALMVFRNRPGSDEPADAPSYVIGHTEVSAAICRQVIQRLRGMYPGRPMIENARSRLSHIDPWPQLRNFILARISKGDSQFGWVLAINKACSMTAEGDSIPLAGSASDWEFGTFEGGLVNSAAIMLSTHGKNLELFEEKEAMLLGVIRALINAIDAKDAYTCGHSDRVACFSRCLAEQLGMAADECDRIYMTGLLHDIGKIGVPDEVLCKPGKLNDEEFAQIKKHPEIGYTILKHLRQLSYVLPGVLHHHESFDGRGYPHGLAGENIPLYGRILAVADAYDAMTSSRPYRSAMPTEKAESILREGAGRQWDARVVEAFFGARAKILAVREKYRPGLPGNLLGANGAELLPEQEIALAVTACGPLGQPMTALSS